ANGNDISFAKRFIVRPFQRYRIPLTILGVSIAVFAGVLFIALSAGNLNRSDDGSTVLSSDIRNLLTDDQETAYGAVETLRNEPDDTGALKILGDFYYDRSDHNREAGDLGATIADAKIGIDYFTRYLAYKPDDADARSDMATLYYYAGDTDRALQEVALVLENNPNHIAGNLNLGIFYFFGRRDLDAAKKQLEHVVELIGDDTTQRPALDVARQLLAQIEAEQSGETSEDTVQTSEQTPSETTTTEQP
ncbi:MAG: tetratricopeptide repeat protein, partial [Actinomycetes bacterium]|nr:tetratricopeptide repeat protein [Actinomycetes bacterium]